MQASQTHPLNGRPSTLSERIGENTELARLRETCRRQAIVIEALTGMLRTLRDGAMALRAENAELREIEASSAKRAGRLRGTRDDADQARRATVQAVRSAISGPHRGD
jgi:hypothetical protein